MERIFFYVYSRKLFVVFTWMIIGVVVWKIVCFCMKNNHQRIWKAMNILILGWAFLLIMYITLKNRTLETKEICLIPFQSFIRAKIQPEIYRSMLMNVFLFFPLGLTMPHALPEKWKHNALLTIIFACVLSIVIEYLQYHFHLGRAETDDVICNTLGCFIGTISYMISKKMVGKKSQDRL